MMKEIIYCFILFQGGEHKTDDIRNLVRQLTDKDPAIRVKVSDQLLEIYDNLELDLVLKASIEKSSKEGDTDLHSRLKNLFVQIRFKRCLNELVPDLEHVTLEGLSAKNGRIHVMLLQKWLQTTTFFEFTNKKCLDINSELDGNTQIVRIEEKITSELIKLTYDKVIKQYDEMYRQLFIQLLLDVSRRNAHTNLQTSTTHSIAAKIAKEYLVKCLSDRDATVGYDIIRELKKHDLVLEYLNDIASLLTYGKDEKRYNTMDSTTLLLLPGQCAIELKKFAIEMLVDHNATQYSEKLSDLMRNDVHVRDVAIAALGKFKAYKYADEIATYLKDESPESAIALALMGQKRYLTEISRFLSSNNISVVKSGLNAIAILEAKEYSKQIAELMNSTSKQIKLAAINTLAKIGAGEYAGCFAKYIADENTERDVRISAIIALGILRAKDHVVDIVKVLSESKDSVVILFSLEALTNIGDKEQSKLIAKFLCHELPSVKIKALKALGTLKATEFKDEIIKLIKDTTRHEIDHINLSVSDTARKVLEDWDLDSNN
ncbi:MAG: HEAT repeat domain-containing protein [Planctomycetes bacterium]|nr:HEAT repeat domain-containing protein [Planctomycetota bacterium]